MSDDIVNQYRVKKAICICKDIQKVCAQTVQSEAPPAVAVKRRASSADVSVYPAPKRCPRCGSARVLQIGWARWNCNGCDKVWSVKRRAANAGAEARAH